MVATLLFNLFVQPSLLNRKQDAASRGQSLERSSWAESKMRHAGMGMDVAPRYIKADRMGSSMDGANYQSEEKRRAEMQVLHAGIP